MAKVPSIHSTFVGSSPGIPPEGLVIIAGVIAQVGNFRAANSDKAGKYHYNPVTGIVATLLLAVIFSLSDNSPLRPFTRGLAWLMILGALLTYVPAFKSTSKKKG